MELMELQDVKLILDKPDKKIYLTYRQKDQKYYIKKIVSRFGKLEVYENLKAYPHPNMPKIYSITQDHEEFILIEEFINGITLNQKMNEITFVPEQAYNIFLQLCNVVSHLHAFQPAIIHRDIKPDNILCYMDSIFLIDYDIAREYESAHTKDTTVIGSVGYAAPEQYGFKQSDTRSDIYAMGVLLNEMLTKENPNVKMVSSSVSRVIKKCISLDPDNRYQSVKELESEFRNITKLKHHRSSYQAYALPGLQNPSKVKRLMAFGGYVLLGSVAFSSTLTNTNIIHPIDEFLFRVVLFITCLLFILIPCNYHNILTFTPLYKSSSRLVRFLNGVFIWFTSFFILAFAYALIRGIIDSLL